MTDNQTQQPESDNFVETALKLSGKSEEEARKTGAIDRADEQVEELFAEKYRTEGSPAHKAVWGDAFPLEQFIASESPTPPECDQVMEKCIGLIKSMHTSGTAYDEHGKMSKALLAALGEAGYWGMLVPKEYGGSGAPFSTFAKFLTRVATIDPTVAGTASVHGCIGAVDPLLAFGTNEQKQRFLPKLASGERISAFALTEPGAGSDLTALRTSATLDGDDYVVNGEKLFITNAIPGRTIAIVCLIEGKPSVLIADLPDEENDQFQVVPYGIYALQHSWNNGLKFNNFRVSAKNRLVPAKGDGLTIAYHGLNRGRVALCAGAAGTMRVMLKNILPWASYRKTYGAAIDTRELVRRRIGHMAGLIVACDALTDWCAWLLDEGYRGEMECIIAKIFGSEVQKEAAIELFMKTHGGRSFLKGHLFGDNVHDFLAPCIYEGEGEMLGMAFFKSLVKVHGTKYFEPIGKALAAKGIKVPNPLNPAHAMALMGPSMPYFKWKLSQMIGGATRASIRISNPKLAEHAQWAADFLQKSRLTVDSLMFKYKLALADRQCAMADLSERIQFGIVALVTCLYASRQEDPLIREAADVLCHHLRNRISGRRPSTGYFRSVTKLGQKIAENGISLLDGVAETEIMQKYDNAE
ncbi:acyl-CoA dehydrogenase [bacterium]|nr:acyl-CoA dehydrogenase [bacterium]